MTQMDDEKDDIEAIERMMLVPIAISVGVMVVLLAVLMVLTVIMLLEAMV